MSPARPPVRALPQGLAELGPFAPSKPAQAGSEPRRSPLSEGQARSAKGVPVSAVHSPHRAEPPPARARVSHRSRRTWADALPWLPLIVPLAALGLCGLTALIWAAVLFAI